MYQINWRVVRNETCEDGRIRQYGHSGHKLTNKKRAIAIDIPKNGWMVRELDNFIANSRKENVVLWSEFCLSWCEIDHVADVVRGIRFCWLQYMCMPSLSNIFNIHLTQSSPSLPTRVKNIQSYWETVPIFYKLIYKIQIIPLYESIPASACIILFRFIVTLQTPEVML